MSVRVDLDTLLRPAVIGINVTVSALTSLFYSRINPKWATSKKESYSANFHYNVKATLFNAATALLAYRVLKAVMGKSSTQSNLVMIPLLLYLRAAFHRSMLIKQTAFQVAKEFMSKTNTLDEAFWGGVDSIKYLTIFRAQTVSGWKEDMFVVQNYPILKNWDMSLIMSHLRS